MVICCGMAVKRMGKLGDSVRKVRALTVKMETVTLIATGRENLTRFMYSVYDVNNKIFFLAGILFLVDHLRCG
jgi:hypothetical protein